jgi:hypothetical protein
VIALPWALEFNMDYTENSDCSVDTLKGLLARSGAIGLGTFRPFFGRFKMTRFEF